MQEQEDNEIVEKISMAPEDQCLNSGVRDPNE
jgi:hypothetical protein